MTKETEPQLAMTEDSQLLEILLEPVVAMCIREGIISTELVPIIEGLYVKQGREDFGTGTEPGNKTVVAVLSGLTRKSVAVHVAGTVSPRQNRLKKLLHLWMTKQPWVAKDGTPKQLPLSGDPSFASLCDATVIGDTTHYSWIRVLEKYGFAERVGDDAIQLLSGRAPFDRPFGLSNPANRPPFDSAVTMLWVLVQQLANRHSNTGSSQVAKKLRLRAERYVDAIPPSTRVRSALALLQAMADTDKLSDDEQMLAIELRNVLSGN